MKETFMIRRLLCFAAMVLLAGYTAGCNRKPQGGKDTGKQVVLQLRPGPDNPRNSEGDFITLKDGRILFIFSRFTGGGGDFSTAHLAAVYSEDQGRSWSGEPVVILSNEGEMNIMSVSLLRLDNGSIALFYLRKNSTSDCIPFMRISTDEAKSWGDAVRCIADTAYFVMNNDRAVQLQSGRILLPVAMHTWGESREFRAGARIKCYYSDDRGASWHASAEAANPEGVVAQEPGVVALKDGTLMLFCRTTAGFQYFSFSEERGETWSPLEPGGLRSPCSPASIERIPSTGDLVAVWNNNLSRDETERNKRTPLTLAISKDEGKSWEKVKNLEDNPDGWYCYTAIAFAGEHLLLAHCSDIVPRSAHLSTTQISRISMDWIYSDTP